MLARKQVTCASELSEGMPSGFEAAFRLVRSLRHDERPPYDKLRSLLG